MEKNTKVPDWSIWKTSLVKIDIGEVEHDNGKVYYVPTLTLFLGDDIEGKNVFAITTDYMYETINLAIFNSDGDKILVDGIMGYELDPFSFSDKIISPGATETETIDVEESCNRISQVVIGDVGEKWCNFVGRLPNDRCRNLIQVGSRVNSISFNK